MKKAKKEDQFSKLPDTIIHCIFSFLGDMTDMTQLVRTSIFSKRWRYLWISAPNLVFRFSENYNRRKRLGKFFNFIHRVLSPSYTSNINKLSIHFDTKIMKEKMIDHIERFIIAALNRNVQEIHLSGEFDCGGELSDHLFTSQLRVFTFTDYSEPCEGCDDYDESPGMYVPSSIASAASIRRLELNNVLLPTTSDGIVTINCSVLEYLDISKCLMYDAKIFTIIAPLLETLVLKNIDCEDMYDRSRIKYDMNIRSSKLKYFELNQYYFSGDFSLEDHSNLATAHITLDFHDYDEIQRTQCLMKLLAGICNVTSLIIPFHLIKIMANSADIFEWLPNKFQNLKRLKLFNNFSGDFSYDETAVVLGKLPRNVDFRLFPSEVASPSQYESLKKIVDRKATSLTEYSAD